MSRSAPAFDPPPERRALGRCEVARTLGISPRTLDRLLARGAFPGPNRYAGRKPLWSVRVVEEWLDGEPPSARPGLRRNRQPA